LAVMWATIDSFPTGMAVLIVCVLLKRLEDKIG